MHTFLSTKHILLNVWSVANTYTFFDLIKVNGLINDFNDLLYYTQCFVFMKSDDYVMGFSDLFAKNWFVFKRLKLDDALSNCTIIYVKYQTFSFFLYCKFISSYIIFMVSRRRVKFSRSSNTSRAKVFVHLTFWKQII